MVRHQIVEKRGRPAFVKIGLRDWARLVRRVEALEDLSDVRAYDAAKARASETVPAAVVDAALDGSPLKAYRCWRGLTQAKLAARAGVSPIYVSMLENGRKNGSIAVLRRLADVLRVDLDMIAGQRPR